MRLESNSLYANALRYALARLLATKVSLFAVFGVIKMSNSGPILNFTRPTWTIMSLLCAIAINAQTAGYILPMVSFWSHSLTVCQGTQLF